MKTTTRRATIIVAAGALSLGGLAVVAPTVAGAVDFGEPRAAASDPGPGWRGGDGAGMGMTGTRMGAGIGAGVRAGGDGTCLNLAATGTLTAQQQTTLAVMAQEEKLAHDLYAAFATTYDASIFGRIAAAETQHLTAVRTVLDRYALADPTAGQPAGTFSDPTVQATYDRLLAQGQANQAAALTVGETVEQADIDALRAALDGLTAPDARQVYEHLLRASQHHLSAFQSWSDR